jgi:hypothetical protein
MKKCCRGSPGLGRGVRSSKRTMNDAGLLCLKGSFTMMSDQSQIVGTECRKGDWPRRSGLLQWKRKRVERSEIGLEMMFVMVE